MKRVICWIFGHLTTFRPGPWKRTLETCERCGRVRYAKIRVPWGGGWRPR